MNKLTALLLPLLLGGQLRAADFPPPAPLTPDCRYLFLVDTSTGMGRISEAVQQTLQRLILTGLDGQMLPGEVFTIWTFSDEVFQRQFPLNAWTPELNVGLANRTLEFMQAQRYRRTANMSVAINAIYQARNICPRLAVILVTDGREVLVGTQFDRQVNIAYGRRFEELRVAKTPFLTTLLCEGGNFVSWFVQAGGEPFVLPHRQDGRYVVGQKAGAQPLVAVSPVPVVVATNPPARVVSPAPMVPAPPPVAPTQAMSRVTAPAPVVATPPVTNAPPVVPRTVAKLEPVPLTNPVPVAPIAPKPVPVPPVATPKVMEIKPAVAPANTVPAPSITPRTVPLKKVEEPPARIINVQVVTQYVMVPIAAQAPAVQPVPPRPISPPPVTEAATSPPPVEPPKPASPVTPAPPPAKQAVTTPSPAVVTPAPKPPEPQPIEPAPPKPAPKKVEVVASKPAPTPTPSPSVTVAKTPAPAPKVTAIPKPVTKSEPVAAPAPPPEPPIDTNSAAAEVPVLEPPNPPVRKDALGVTGARGGLGGWIYLAAGLAVLALAIGITRKMLQRPQETSLISQSMGGDHKA